LEPNARIEFVNASITERTLLARRGQRLEYFTIAWNSIEALAALIAGILAGSVALVGFGLDSVIEVFSGAALLWRLQHDVDRRQREDAERIALRIVGGGFMILAAYITFDSLLSILSRKAPEHSLAGVVVAIAALVAMPLLGRAKRDVARRLSSAPMHSDAKQAISVFTCPRFSSVACCLICGWAGGGLIRWRVW
jgi:divalent metal cation (Fe/Co/Zn/Cd) transporter